MKLAAAKNPDLQMKMSTEVKRIHKNKATLTHEVVFKGWNDSYPSRKGDRISCPNLPMSNFGIALVMIKWVPNYLK